ncbi:hypothetical protein A2773_06950 [Candidatus Gottesmanbacteria bacterium RIFCSPHIGHO2_01_FULL_39_10]|uniref:Uncharacterized protein n=1 Tax=Candidatus Gottesmanbacteria bacterium RIFCSPHIGHO2_01_FULL_39_10 TaxID=1798375 RepID=A0A1F5ZQN8_9BACT|nr:MAG: hypothetical protein A2773_06950 [Candidatus Gottesmanbacteria bacterium RIFCSPHIGHO2_01_FULL_39_10]
MNPTPTEIPPIPQTPSSPPIPPPPAGGTPKFPLFPILGGIVLIVSIATGAYLLGKSQGNSKADISPSPTSSLYPEPSRRATPDPTANWKTYTNSKYNYQLSYPPNFTATTDESGQIPGVLVANSDKTITIALTAPTGSLAGNASEKLIPVPDLKFIINGVTYTPEEAFYFPSEKLYKFRINPLLKDGKTWGFDGVDIFSFYGSYTKPEDIKLINQILSTFKFVDQKDELSCQTDSDCSVELCGCKAKNKNFIDTSKNICTVMCGNATCTNKKCLLQPYKGY